MAGGFKSPELTVTHGLFSQKTFIFGPLHDPVLPSIAHSHFTVFLILIWSSCYLAVLKAYLIRSPFPKALFSLSLLSTNKPLLIQNF